MEYDKKPGISQEDAAQIRRCNIDSGVGTILVALGTAGIITANHIANNSPEVLHYVLKATSTFLFLETAGIGIITTINNERWIRILDKYEKKEDEKSDN